VNYDIVALAQGVMTAMLVDLAADSTFVIPSRQYLTAGEVAFDCEELVVHGVRISAGLGGLAGMTRTREDVTFSIELGVTVVRCVPIPQTMNYGLDPVTLNNSGKLILGDGGALLRAALSAWQRGALLPPCQNLIIGPVNWTGPGGGVIGSTLTLHAQM
jgi:hypothetical protein